MHMQETEQKRWIQDRVEVPRVELSHDEKIRILRKLNQAEAFERFLHTKYVGHKRFGLEGSESVIPMLDSLLSAAALDGMEEVVIGMAHRGRLNILTNVIGKSYAKIFREFEGDLDPDTTGGSGDVKYHLGFSGKYETADGSMIGAQLVANPSHLEAVDPVLEGVVRAKQEKRGPAGAHPGAPDLAPWRRRLRRPGRRGRGVQPFPTARLPDRRHRPHRDQQPGWLHDLDSRCPVELLRHRRRQDRRRSHHPRKRR